MKKKLLISFLFLSGLCCSAQAQLQPVKNVPSPEIAGLGEYGKVPVSLFTGIPNISIPLYEVKVGNFSLPISASYHPSSVKANSPSGCLGLGWNLMAGGYITRKVNGILDEKYCTVNNGKVIAPGYYSNAYRLKNISTKEFENLNKYAVNQEEDKFFEISADEFAFDFCGYTGNFYYNQDGGWTVVSDQDIKVLFDPQEDGFITPDLLTQVKRIDCSEWDHKNYNQRFFNKFTLVTPDGCHYEFGGPNATEFSAPYFHRKKSDLVPTTWRLTKIITVDKKIIELIYDTSSIVCEIKYVPQQRIINGIQTAANPNPTTGRAGMTGYLMFPVNLSKITTPNEVIEFSYILDKYFSQGFYYRSKCYLGWTNITNEDISRFNLYESLGDDNQPHNQFHVFLGFENQAYKTNNQELCQMISNKLRNLLLNTISVKKNQYGNAYEEIKFRYTKSPDERRKLLSIEEKYANSFSPFTNASGSDLIEIDEAHILDPKTRTYLFTYGPRKLPVSLIDPKADSWGYYNGGQNDIFHVGADMFELPIVSATAAKSDILAQIRYPTGGKVVFDYEGHSYSKIQNFSRQKLDNLRGYAGGLRVAQITKIDSNDNVTEIKKYHYSEMRNATGISQCSGILNILPTSKCRYTTPKNYIELASVGGYFATTTNHNSPNVGYSCVIEETLNADNVSLGYVKYHYTNYDKDIYGQTHLDEPAWYYSGITELNSTSPYTSRSMERGKLLSEEHFDRYNKLKKKITYHYTKTDSSYLITGHQIPLFLENNSCPDLAIGYLTKTYLYSYLTDTITETLYTDLENVAIEKIQTMEYTARKLLKKTTTATSQGNLRTVEYEYNSDNPSYQWPGLKHILNLLTKKTTTENNQKRQEEYGYGYGEKCIPYLSEVTTTINNDPSQTTYKVKSAGYNGKPVEIEEQGVTSLLLWGYGGQRIIAKIVNASLERLYELPGFGSFDYEDNWESAYAKIESIRQQLPSSQFFVYTYDNRLKLQSIANPNGVTEFFNYDFLGRLIERYYTERTENGWQKRLLNRYDYNYSL